MLIIIILKNHGGIGIFCLGKKYTNIYLYKHMWKLFCRLKFFFLFMQTFPKSYLGLKKKRKKRKKGKKEKNIPDEISSPKYTISTKVDSRLSPLFFSFFRVVFIFFFLFFCFFTCLSFIFMNNYFFDQCPPDLEIMEHFAWVISPYHIRSYGLQIAPMIAILLKMIHIKKKKKQKKILAFFF